MIAAEIKTSPFYQLSNGEWPKSTDESDMEKWCLSMIGPKAKFRDHVSDEYPWTYSHSHGWSTWHFAREEYATMFSLRWL